MILQKICYVVTVDRVTKESLLLNTADGHERSVIVAKALSLAKDNAACRELPALFFRLRFQQFYKAHHPHARRPLGASSTSLGPREGYK